MQIKLNEEAKKSLISAKIAAKEKNRSDLGSEIILLGLLKSPGDLVRDTLECLEIKTADLFKEIDAGVPLGSSDKPQKDYPFAKSAKEVLSAAAKHAEALNTEQIGPEHLLLGILDLEKNLAFSIFKAAAKENTVKIKEDLLGYLVRLDKRRKMKSLFNDQATTVIVNARNEAERQKNVAIEPAHILHGIMDNPGSVATASLVRIKVNLKQIHKGLSEIMEELPKEKSKGHQPSFSEETKIVLDKTVEASESMGHRHIGPEHFLLGILLSKVNVAKIIEDAGANDYDFLKDEIQIILNAQG